MSFQQEIRNSGMLELHQPLDYGNHRTITQDLQDLDDLYSGNF